MNRKPRLLVIDDNPESLKFLPDFGYDTYYLSKGKDILTFLKETEETFDLVLIDVLISFISGWEVLKFLRNSPKFEYLPIIVTTTLTEKTDELLALRSGADDFIRKPFDMDLVLARVDVALRRAMWNNLTYVNINKLGFMKMPKDPQNLTNREKTILSMLANGQSNEEIAKELCLSLLTVKTHKKNIFKKLNVSNRTEAIIAGVNLGMVQD